MKITPNKLTCIDVKFIFDSLRLGLSSSANILQIAVVALRVVFLLFLLWFLPLLRLVPAVVFTLETSEVSAIFIFTAKTTQPRSNGALTCKNCISDVISSLKSKFFQIWSSLKLVMVNCACAFSQSELGKYFEWIIIVIIF